MSIEQIIPPNVGQPGIFSKKYLGFFVDMGQMTWHVPMKLCDGISKLCDGMSTIQIEREGTEFLLYLVQNGNLLSLRFRGSLQQLNFIQSQVISPYGVPHPGQKYFGGCPMYMEHSWFCSLSDEFDKDYFIKLSDAIQDEREHSVVYPAPENVFAWTWACKCLDVKVVILGQDPYHNGLAHGLAFSIMPGTPIPPFPPSSLSNIYNELELEGIYLPGQRPNHGYLMGWARQGVLLLNTWLTVKAGEAYSHRDKGWDIFTDAVIAYLNHHHYGLVFMLWGEEAQKKEQDINKSKHTVLTARHPSPYFQSDGNTFIGNGNFSNCNAALVNYNKKPINWSYLPID